MTRLFLALVLACTCACSSLAPGPITVTDARNAISAGQNGLAHVSPIVDEFCASRDPQACAVLRADLRAAGAALAALQAAVDAPGSADLSAAAERLGQALRMLLLELQAARAAQGA